MVPRVGGYKLASGPSSSLCPKEEKCAPSLTGQYWKYHLLEFSHKVKFWTEFGQNQYHVHCDGGVRSVLRLPVYLALYEVLPCIE